HRSQTSSVSLPPDPQPAKRKKSKHGGVGQRARAIQSAEQRPESQVSLPAADSHFSERRREVGHPCVRQIESQQKDTGQNEWRKRRVPYPVNRPVPHVGVQPPRIGRPCCNAFVEASAGNQEYGNTGER